MVRARVVALVFVVGLLAVSTTTAQPNAAKPTNLALEVHFYPGEPPAYVTVPPANSRPGGWSH